MSRRALLAALATVVLIIVLAGGTHVAARGVTIPREIQAWGRTFRNGLAILGVDGDLATSGAGTPAVGKVQAKSGSRAGITPADHGIITAITLAGYADTASGRQVGFAIFLRDLSFRSFDEFFAARNDQAAIAVAIQQAY